MTDAPVSPLTLTDGRFAVPGNRWDMLSDSPSRLSEIAVVIPYFEQQRDLELVLRALELQTYPLHLIEVVVADDGSSRAPVLPASPLRVTVVRQADLGFRAAAARNLGAAATDAGTLCFLDADTVPEPDYLSRLTRLPGLLPDALVVGRRRHADFGDLTADGLSDWWSGRRVPRILDEPRWLTDGYESSGNMLHVDHRSYRYVISSVMCCTRELFDDIGGFDESFRRYGGEDWEFAHRAVVGGAVLHHAHDAVAWHDGPDWAGRDVSGRAAAKNGEALALARRLTDPDARRQGLRYEYPDIAVEVDTTSHGTGSLVTALGCFLHEDVGIWLVGPDARRLFDDIGASDQRLHVGEVPAEIGRRCRFVVTTHGRPALPREAVSLLLAECAREAAAEVRVVHDETAVVIRSSWALNRARRWGMGVHTLGSTTVLPAQELGLTSVDPDANLSW
jgi:GT2 family glycosyltransferase